MDIRAKIEARIAAEHAKPDTHVGVVTFTDGTDWRQPCKSAAAAENFVSSYRRLIGTHEFISRKTGQKIRVASVAVVALAIGD